MVPRQFDSKHRYATFRLSFVGDLAEVNPSDGNLPAAPVFVFDQHLGRTYVALPRPTIAGPWLHPAAIKPSSPTLLLPRFSLALSHRFRAVRFTVPPWGRKM